MYYLPHVQTSISIHMVLTTLFTKNMGCHVAVHAVLFFFFFFFSNQVQGEREEYFK